ncbi:MAG: tripartite tricarboxylate transporter TctB family protein [Pseudomonadota bacterium]
MEQKQTQDRPPRGGLTHSTVEAITAVSIFLIGAVMMIDSYRSGSGWATDGPQTGYFPLRIGAIICIASIVILMKALFSKKRNLELFVAWEPFKQVLLVLALTAVYVLAIQVVGIYVASSLFIGLFMRMVGKFGWLKIVLVSICTSVALFWMFEVQFMVPLPKGPLEALLGY